MKTKMKKAAMLLITASLVFLLAACGGSSSSNGGNEGSAEKTYNFKMGHETPNTHLFHATAEKFAEELEKRSNGRMKVQIFPARQLGEEKDMVQQLETGAMEFAIITNSYMTTRSDFLNAMFMPFIFEDITAASQARKTETVKKMFKELESQGLKAFDYVFAGNRHLLMVKNPVTSPEDLKGLKVRTLTAESNIDFWNEVGVGPAPMPLSEIYTSLQTGMIDGVDIDLDAIVSVKFYEVAKNLTISNHSTLPSIMMASKKVFDSLPPEDQKIVEEAMMAAAEWSNQEVVKRESENLKKLEEAGININKINGAEVFKAEADKVKAKWAEKSPLIKEFLEEISKLP